eukprot:scaffold4854_cov131-Isochrysis_galbana.AAC.8
MMCTCGAQRLLRAYNSPPIIKDVDSDEEDSPVESKANPVNSSPIILDLDGSSRNQSQSNSQIVASIKRGDDSRSEDTALTHHRLRVSWDNIESGKVRGPTDRRGLGFSGPPGKARDDKTPLGKQLFVASSTAILARQVTRIRAKSLSPTRHLNRAWFSPLSMRCLRPCTPPVRLFSVYSLRVQPSIRQALEVAARVAALRQILTSDPGVSPADSDKGRAQPHDLGPVAVSGPDPYATPNNGADRVPDTHQLVKGDSRDPDIGRLAHVLSAILVSIRARPWMDYVRSAANIADLPSRFDIEGLKRGYGHSSPPPDTTDLSLCAFGTLLGVRMCPS